MRISVDFPAPDVDTDNMTLAGDVPSVNIV